MGSSNNNELVTIYNIIESKAWLSCNLMSSLKQSDKDEGYKYFQHVLKESALKIGANDSFTNGWHCYFAIHFIRNNEWMEAHKLMDQILRIQPCSDKMKQDIHGVFVDYVEIMNQCIDRIPFGHKSVFIQKFEQKINAIMSVLHDRHVQFIKDINFNSMVIRNEYMERS